MLTFATFYRKRTGEMNASNVYIYDVIILVLEY